MISAYLTKKSSLLGRWYVPCYLLKAVTNGIQMYLINGTAGHARIYKNTKGKGLEYFYRDLLNRKIPSNVDFGASVFPYGK